MATNIITMAYARRSRPERISSFARSIPRVINGNPGIIKSIAHIYPASCWVDTARSASASFSKPEYVRQDTAIDETIHRNKVK